MARTLKMAKDRLQIDRLVLKPIEDLLAAKDDGLTTMRNDEEFQDMREDIMGFDKRIVPVTTIEETESNVLLDENFIRDDGAKKWEISEHPTILLENLFEIDENPHIDIKEKEDRKEIILDNADHAWNEKPVDEPLMDELRAEQLRAEQLRAEQLRAEQLCVEEPCAKHPRMDELQDLRAIGCSVAVTPNSMLETQDNEFKTVEEIKEEEERLVTEIKKRSEVQKTINKRLTRIKRMREFLRSTSQLSDIEDIETLEKENEQMEKQVNEAIEEYFALAGQNISFSDKVTIVDDNGKSMCEAWMVVMLKDKKPKKREKKTYRIIYDITGSEINRSSCVFKDEDTLETNKAKKTVEASTSRVTTTRSMTNTKRNKKNLSTNSASNESMQLRKRRNMQWNTSLRGRKQIVYQPRKRKGPDPTTLKRNEKGRFVKRSS